MKKMTNALFCIFLYQNDQKTREKCTSTLAVVLTHHQKSFSFHIVSDLPKNLSYFFVFCIVVGICGGQDNQSM